MSCVLLPGLKAEPRLELPTWNVEGVHGSGSPGVWNWCGEGPTVFLGQVAVGEDNWALSILGTYSGALLKKGERQPSRGGCVVCAAGYRTKRSAEECGTEAQQRAPRNPQVCTPQTNELCCHRGQETVAKETDFASFPLFIPPAACLFRPRSRQTRSGRTSKHEE